MKNLFFKNVVKTILVAGSVLALYNCGDDASSTNNPSYNSSVYVVDEDSFVFSDGNVTYLIGASGIVRDTLGNPVGTIDVTTGSIIANDLTTVISTGVSFENLEIVSPTVITDAAWVMKVADKVYVIYGNGTVTDASGVPFGTYTAVDPANPAVISIVDANGSPFVENVDLTTLRLVQATANSSASVEPPDPGTTPSQTTSSASTPTDEDDNGNTTPVAKSSSSVGGTTAKSSSSTAKSSSSVAVSSSSKPAGYTIQYINGGKSGSGYATRYWDCCEPHCAWPEHGGKASTCDASGNKVQGGSTSMCDGGNAGICRNQFPIVVNDTLAFAFAATPGGENNCGKCFDLKFTGEGKYATNLHKKLIGKHLIVMSNNVGYDVAGGQFDVMIPGGGFGIFDGCSARMGWGSQGSQYGGLLDECEKKVNYMASKYKTCLTDKCNASFANDPEAKEGCLFMANWMEAAGNPLLTYKEVECPQELLDRF